MDDERAQRHGALTGESGTVTPPEVDEEFIPAERRAMEGTSAEPADVPAAKTERDEPEDETPAIEPPIGDEIRIDPQDDRY
jgi:hypothetical protein